MKTRPYFYTPESGPDARPPLLAACFIGKSGKPLASIEGWPGDGVDLSEAELRAFAAALLEVADRVHATR